jgi:hypothetical protein
MLAYKIFGLQPGFAEGLLFHSCVQNLQDHPDLWLDECPYLHPTWSSAMLAGMRVELVEAENDSAYRPALRRALNAQSPMSQAA